MEEIPNNHLGCIKPCKKPDNPPTLTGYRRISEPSTVFLSFITGFPQGWDPSHASWGSLEYRCVPGAWTCPRLFDGATWSTGGELFLGGPTFCWGGKFAHPKNPWLDPIHWMGFVWTCMTIARGVLYTSSKWRHFWRVFFGFLGHSKMDGHFLQVTRWAQKLVWSRGP